MIRELGDYTKKLSKKAKVGMLADIYAPHGDFKRMSNAEREIWIGAGVGISPFISWLEDKTVGHFERATLVYCFNPSRVFPSVEHMQEMTEQSGVEFVARPKWLVMPWLRPFGKSSVKLIQSRFKLAFAVQKGF